MRARRIIAVALLAVLLSCCLWTVPPFSGARGGTARAAGGSRFYFAEGCTGPGFAEFLCICNPNPSDTIARVSFFFTGAGGKANFYYDYFIAQQSRLTLNVATEAGEGSDVSLLVESGDAGLVAERPMYFNYAGVWTGGSCTVGAPAPSTDNYFAEGYTGPGFDTWVCVLNPNAAPAELTFRFQTQEEGEVVRHGRVDPQARATFLVNDLLGPDYQTSLHLESTQPVVAERPMYFAYQGTGGYNWPGGHCVMGAAAPAAAHLFAEGTTRAGFEEWLCIQNPGDAEITVHASYLFGPGQGAPCETDYAVPARSRRTVRVEEEVGPGLDVSCRLTCSSGVFMAERPMYFKYRSWCTGGSCVKGTPAASPQWVFAEGCTAALFYEWLCVFNPGAAPNHLTLRYFTDDGQVLERTHTVDGLQRLTINVNEDAGSGLDLSVMVSAEDPGVLVERPMYFLYDWQWPGGSCVVGHPAGP